MVVLKCIFLGGILPRLLKNKNFISVKMKRFRFNLGSLYSELGAIAAIYSIIHYIYFWVAIFYNTTGNKKMQCQNSILN